MQGTAMIIRSALLMLLVGVTLRPAAAEAPHITTQRENATSVLVISPIFSQLVAFKMPLDFKVVNEETSAHGYIRESVPMGENVEHWSRMITVTGYKDVAANPGPPPAVLLNTIAEGFRKACPDSVSVGDLGSPSVDGYPAAAAFIACGTTISGGKPHSEAALVMAIKGARDYYTIQWAERGAAQATPVAFDGKHWVGQFKQLMPIFLCQRIPGEQAPYPSCISRLSSDNQAPATHGSQAVPPLNAASPAS
ncbi:hypothetical protein ASD22_07440 [Rhodanobacter sp. Root480]|jgi:hypothetical protein|nr:hypothetical protein ASD22_07440 [Rhodanobacter sp. Root480]